MYYEQTSSVAEKNGITIRQDNFSILYSYSLQISQASLFSRSLEVYNTTGYFPVCTINNLKN